MSYAMNFFIFFFDPATQFGGICLNFEQKHMHEDVSHTIILIRIEIISMSNNDRIVNKLWHIM